MRILHWTEHFWPLVGGVETLVDRLVEIHRRHGHESVIFANQQEHNPLASEEVHQGATIHRFPFGRALVANDIRGIRGIVDRVGDIKRRFQPDLVHLHLSGPSPWFHLLTQPTVKVPTLVTVHTPLDHLTAPPQMVRRLLQEADGIVAVSGATRAGLGAIDGALMAKAGVVLNGLPAPQLLPTELAWKPAVFLCLGRMVPVKGFDLALQAYAQIASRWPSSRLIMGGDGLERGNLARLARELGLDDRVEFRGLVQPDQVPALINESTLMLVPSRWQEPFGLVALEAAQMGRPVVAARVGGLAEVITHGETGILVPPNDAGALAEAVESLLHDPAQAARLGANARRRALAEFSMERCAEAYEELYRKLASPMKAAGS